ncbi:uncharacterized protein LOC112342467 [Selaginella moellendorffii]|uniref:uncharacterized protein LOC112342467 n=1 Tax=Selaginella moellendorffii TaxID=88036 RepID=UPI000D1C9F74|nr:uncharacterized protein LOC112342467 [Selaginella moellendorffii]|eukprot:XP_024520118.1 uncharacterized protein LOC112342467 [Selaginella moellendorffii]
MDAEGADPAISQLTSLKDDLKYPDPNLRPDSTKFKRELDARAKEEVELFYVRWNSDVLIPARFPISTLLRLLQAASTALHTTASPSTGELPTKRTISSIAREDRPCTRSTSQRGRSHSRSSSTQSCSERPRARRGYTPRGR